MLLDITGAWSVGLVPDDGRTTAVSDRRSGKAGGGYGGHLILKVEDWLIDATIKQAERPDKGIVLPNMVTSRHASDLLAGERLHMDVGDVLLAYELIDDMSYRSAPAWTRRTTPFPETVRKILTRLEKAS